MLHRVKKKDDQHAGKWNGVGGKFEAGETPEECAIREVKEETGLIIRNPRLAGRVLFPHFDKNGEDWHIYVFIITEFTGELIDSPEGELAWIADEDVLSLTLWAADKFFLPWIEARKYFSAKFVYDGEDVIEQRVVFHDFL